MLCQKCGIQYENVKFCPECGTRFDEVVPIQQPQTPYEQWLLPDNQSQHKKKKDGCLIAFLVIAGLLTFLLVISFIGNKIADGLNLPSSGGTSVSDLEALNKTTTLVVEETNQISESTTKKMESEPNKQLLDISNSKVGDIVYYGKYEQDNNIKNGKERIAWKVLEISRSKALLLSDQILDSVAYNNAVTITWEKCALRKWLNSDFMNSAFTNNEQLSIDTSYIVNSKNPSGIESDGGNNTSDKLFCLSYEEADSYFSYDENRKAKGTVYAKSKGLYVEAGNTDAGYSDWWLRSTGPINVYAGYVRYDGNLYSYDINTYQRQWRYHIVDLRNVGVRPAIWVTF